MIVDVKLGKFSTILGAVALTGALAACQTIIEKAAAPTVNPMQDLVAAGYKLLSDEEMILNLRNAGIFYSNTDGASGGMVLLSNSFGDNIMDAGDAGLKGRWHIINNRFCFGASRTCLTLMADGHDIVGLNDAGEVVADWRVVDMSDVLVDAEALKAAGFEKMSSADMIRDLARKTLSYETAGTATGELLLNSDVFGQSVAHAGETAFPARWYVMNDRFCFRLPVACYSLYQGPGLIAVQNNDGAVSQYWTPSQ
jgi:hypothetical protein